MHGWKASLIEDLTIIDKTFSKYCLQKGIISVLKIFMQCI